MDLETVLRNAKLFGRELDRDKAEAMLAEIEKRQATEEAENTPENEARLVALAKAHGMKVRRFRAGVEGYAFTNRTGQTVEGLSLAFIDRMMHSLGVKDEGGK